jgi:uncharacterized protein with GYD domain
MPTFISTIQFTEQGLRDIAQTTKRAQAFETAAQQAGAKVTGVYWTLGDCDGLLIFEAANDEAATTLMLRLGKLGNVRTKTCRAFSAADMARVLANV